MKGQKRILSFLLVLILIFTAGSSTIISAKSYLKSIDDYDGLIIKEAYGGGGNKGAPFLNDYVVLKNTTDNDINLDNISLQYASYKEDSKFNGVVELKGNIKAGSYYVIKLDGNNNTRAGIELPRYDLEANIAMSKEKFKLALARGTEKIDSYKNDRVIDYVAVGAKPHKGEGPAPEIDNTSSIWRKHITGDNSKDFIRKDLDETSLDYLIEDNNNDEGLNDIENLIPEEFFTEKNALNIKEVLKSEKEKTYKVIGKVSYVFDENQNYKNKNIIIEDIIDGESYGLMVFRVPIDSCHEGDIILVEGEYTEYNKNPQIKSIQSESGEKPLKVEIIETEKKDKIEPESVTIDKIKTKIDNYVNRFVEIDDLEIKEISSNNGKLIIELEESGGETIKIYDAPVNISDFNLGDKVKVRGAVNRFNDNIQLRINKKDGIYLLKSNDQDGSEDLDITSPIDSDLVSKHNAIRLDEALEKKPGDKYKTIGQITYIYEKNSHFGNATIVIQDVIDGKMYGHIIYRGDYEGIEVGDIITVEGIQGEYGENLQIQQGSKIEKVAQADPMPPQEVTLTEVLNSGEKYLNQYIKIKDLTLGEYNNGNPVFTDKNGNSIGSHKAPEYPEGAGKGTNVDIEAVLSKHFNKIQLRLGATSDYLVHKDVNNPPFIKTLKLDNATIGYDYNFAIEAEDDKGVKNVIAKYKIGKETGEIELNLNNGKYEGTISKNKLKKEGNIELEVIAEDEEGLKGSKIFTISILEPVNIEDPIKDEDIPEDVLNIKEAKQAKDGSEIKVIGQVTYNYGGSSYIIQDIIEGEIVGYQLFSPPEHLNIGDIVIAKGKATDFYGLKELANIEEVKFVSNKTPIPPQVVTIEQLKASDDYVNELVRINDVTLPKYNGDGSIRIKDKTGEIEIYRPAEYPIGTKEGDVVDIIGAGSKHYNNVQLRTNSKKDYIIKNDTMPPVITIGELMDAKVGLDYKFAIDVEDNVDVKDVFAEYKVDKTTKEIELELNEINGKYQGIIPGEEIGKVDKIDIKFKATDVNNNKSSKETVVKVIDKPQIIKVTPEANTSYMGGNKPKFEVVLQNIGENAKVYLTINDNKVEMNLDGNKATWQVNEEMDDGEVVASVEIIRSDNVKSDPYSWSFFIGERTYNFYFGQIHSHSNYSDGSGTPEEAVRYARDKAEQIDWFALTDHSNYFDSANNLGKFDDENSGTKEGGISKWKRYKEIIESSNTEDFLALYGFEMTWSNKEYGHINTYNTEGFVSRNNSELNAPGGSGLKKYYGELTELDPDTTFSQFNHPGATFGNFSNFAYYEPEYDKAINLIEVGNGDGPVNGKGYWPSYEQYTLALDKGWHLAPSNNQDNHRKKWGDSNTARTVAIAPNLEKNSIISAVKNYSVYATEDNNFEVYYTVNNRPMGSIYEEKNKTLNFVVDFKDPDSEDIINSIKVISNGGVVVHEENPGTNQGRLEFELDNKYSYYYLDIQQADGDRIVTAPVWTGEYDIADAGIKSLEKDTDIEYLGEEIELTTKLYNNEDSKLKINKIEYEIMNDNIGTNDVNIVLNKGESKELKYNYKPTVAGKNSLSVKVYGEINGVERIFVETIELDVKLSKDELKLTSIDKLHLAEEGQPFMVEGYLTTNVSGYDRNTAFFDSAYIQDETGGINIFPISGNYKKGEKLRIKGQTSSFEGERQLNIVEVEKIEDDIKIIEPKEIEVKDVDKSIGQLIKVSGTVAKINYSGDIIESILLKDGDHFIRVFIDGYIGGTLEDGSTVDVNNFDMSDIKKGDLVEAVGLSSIDNTINDGHDSINRIRVRDRAEIKLIEDDKDDNKDDNKPIDPIEPDSPTKPNQPDQPDGQDKPEDIEFTDLARYEWARESIYNLTNEGYIKGRTKDKYDPESYITRAEFAVLVSRIFAKDINGTNPKFKDVYSDAWYAEGIFKSYEKGLIEGYPDGYFRPNDKISREEVAKILEKIVDTKGYNIKAKDFKDYMDISNWAKPGMDKLIRNKIFIGYDDNTIKPKNNISRAEIAVVLDRTLKVINK